MNSSLTHPFLHGETDCKTVRVETFIALIPAALWAFCQFGLRSLILAVISAGFSLLLDFIYQFIFFLTNRRKKIRPDLLAPLMGLLIAFAMPVNVALWLLFLADFTAVILFRRLLAGIASPTAAGCSLAMLVSAGFTLPAALTDGEHIRTPLDQLMAGVSPEESLQDLILGRVPGGIGEVSGLLLLIGGLYLILRRHLSWEVPLAVIAAAGGVAILCTPSAIAYNIYIIGQIFSGGLIFGAIFVASESIYTPLTLLGKLIYGGLIGALALLLRAYLGFDGIYPAILLMSALTPLIDRLTAPAMFGGNPRRDRAQSKRG
ncbi:MAG: RnfABCDGE type electron transport complex subunit D [Eubacteriales bacterium]